MRNYAVLAAGAGLALTGAAKASFIVTDTITFGTGMFAGDYVFTFKVKNDGIGDTAGTSKLLALDVKMEAEDPRDQSVDPNGKFFIRTFDSTGGNEVNPSDADLADQGPESPSGSYVRAGSAAGFTVVSTTPNYQSPVSEAAVHNPTDYTDGQWLHSFEVVGLPGLTTGGLNASSPITFAQAVVPEGQPVILSGQFGAESGSPHAFEVITFVPEPASVGLIGVGALGLLRRCRVSIGLGGDGS